MNESTTRPDCPVGPDESPTLVTWCDGCGAADIRLQDSPIHLKAVELILAEYESLDVSTP